MTEPSNTVEMTPAPKPKGALKPGKQPNCLDRYTSLASSGIQAGEVETEKPNAAIQDPFANESDSGVKYKVLKWWQCGALLVAETVSLGILSLPDVVGTMGFVPGILLIVFVGILATYTGYVIGQFKQRNMHIHNFADAGAMMLGPSGRYFAEVCQALLLICIMAAHVLTFGIMCNVLSDHGTCTLVFTLVGTIISFVLTLPRKLANMSNLSILSCASITGAILITMIGVGIKKPGIGDTYAFVPANLTGFPTAVSAVASIVLAFSGHVAFMGFIAELEQPRDFPKSLAILQITAISFYVTVAVVIYYYAGQDVASPALGSASTIVKKVAYATAIPTIVIAGVVNAHVCVKNIYVRMWRGTNVMHERSLKSYSSWIAICAATWIAAWLLASGIPVFHQLLGLIGALFSTWFTFGIPAAFWFYMNRGMYFRNWRSMCLFFLNMGIFIICIAICGLGTYGSAKSIADTKHTSGAFSCADNSLQ